MIAALLSLERRRVWTEQRWLRRRRLTARLLKKLHDRLAIARRPE